MVVEVKGSQLRIQLHSPERYKEFRTQDVGLPGGLQRIAGHNGIKWETQGWRLKLDDYDREGAIEVVKSLKIKSSTKRTAMSRINTYYK